MSAIGEGCEFQALQLGLLPEVWLHEPAVEICKRFYLVIVVLIDVFI
jgi:hypothetical protein